MDLEDQLNKLADQLIHASAREAARIQTRIQELKKLQQQEHTT